MFRVCDISRVNLDIGLEQANKPHQKMWAIISTSLKQNIYSNEGDFMRVYFIFFM
jgi:hypothetical protein